MDQHAVLAVSVIKAVNEKGRNKVREDYLVLADVAEKAIKQMESLVYELTKDKLGDEKAREFAKVMVEGRWTHDYPITVEEARKLGLPIKTEVPNEVYQLMELYPQPHAIRPSVEFVPAPYLPPSQRRSQDRG